MDKLVHETLVMRSVKIGSVVPELSGDNDDRNLVEEVEASFQMGSKELVPVKWTDEKHSLYLESMEASFIHQLHNSSNLLGWSSQKRSSSPPKSSDQKHTRKHSPSGQFKVFQDGREAKINLSRGDPQLNKSNESGFLLSNPWIKHYRSGFRENTKRSTWIQEKETLDISLEVTDQNFTDEDCNEKIESRTSSKRMKTTEVTVPNQDQVVPFVKISSTEDVAEHHMSSGI